MNSLCERQLSEAGRLRLGGIPPKAFVVAGWAIFFFGLVVILFSVGYANLDINGHAGKVAVVGCLMSGVGGALLFRGSLGMWAVLRRWRGLRKNPDAYWLADHLWDETGETTALARVTWENFPFLIQQNLRLRLYLRQPCQRVLVTLSCRQERWLKRTRLSVETQLWELFHEEQALDVTPESRERGLEVEFFIPAEARTTQLKSEPRCYWLLSIESQPTGQRCEFLVPVYSIVGADANPSP